MNTPIIEQFEHVIRDKTANELIPFLLNLAKTDITAVREKLKSLKKELETMAQITANGWGIRATNEQSNNLFLAGFAVYSRREALANAITGAWVIGSHPTEKSRMLKQHFLSLVTSLRPNWLHDWLLNQQVRASEWAVDYKLLRALEHEKLIPFSPTLTVRSLPNALMQWGWDLSFGNAIPLNAAEVIATELSNDQLFITRDLPLIFDFNTPITNVWAHIQPPMPLNQKGDKQNGQHIYPWQVWNQKHPPQTVGWQHLFLHLTASGHLDRADILTRCLLALRRDFRRPLLTWFKELFLALHPTPAERLTRQTELTELLAHPLPLVVNFALDQLKDLWTEPAFRLDALLLYAEGLLTRQDLKTGIKTLLSGFGKLLKLHPAQAPTLARLHAAALAHADGAVQERAARGLADILQAKKPLLTPAETAETTDSLRRYAELLGPAARAVVAPWLAAAEETATPPEPAEAYAPLADFQPDISPATAIAPVADWHELLFLTGQVLRHDDPLALERWLDGLLRLHAGLPAGHAGQLQPYVVQLLPQLKKTSGAEAAALLAGPIAMHGHDGLAQGLLLSWMTGFAVPRVASVQVAGPHGTRSPLLALDQQRYVLAEARLRDHVALPLLSTPTHQPGWLAPTELVRRLLAYQTRGVAPTPADLALALARAAHAHPADAAEARQLLPQLADARLRALLGWFLGLPGQPLPALPVAGERQPADLFTPLAHALPELWAVAARTKNPTGAFPALAASLGYDYPGTTQPLHATWVAVPHENRYPNPNQPGQESSYCFVELAWDSGARAAAPSPLLLYAPPVGKSRHGSWESNQLLASDLPYLAGLLSNYAAPVYDQALRCAAWADNLETTERDVLAQALRTLLGPGPAFAPAQATVLASGLVHHSSLCRSLGQEVLLQAVAHGRVLPGELGNVLGLQLAAGYVPVPRLATSLASLGAIDAPTDGALHQTLDALLPELPAAPLRNTRKLLDAYADLVGRTRRPVPPAVQARLREWQATPALKKVAAMLLAQGKS